MESLEPGTEEGQCGSNPETFSKAVCSWRDVNIKVGSWALLFRLW